MAAPMRFIPICCTVDTSAEVLDRFLTTAYTEFVQKHDLRFFVIIRDAQVTYKEASLPPIKEAVTDSPFNGKPALDCGKILRSIYTTTASEIHYRWSVILDERTSRDETVLLVRYDEAKEDVDTIRAISAVAMETLLSHSAKLGTFDEEREAARKQPDGVLRL